VKISIDANDVEKIKLLRPGMNVCRCTYKINGTSKWTRRFSRNMVSVIITITAVLCALLEIVDFTIVNVALTICEVPWLHH
jgi:hypothetical protein